MATVAAPDATRKPAKAFYCTYRGEAAQLVQVGGVIHLVTEKDVQPLEVAMAPWVTVLGEIGLCDTQHILDALVHRGYAWIACSRKQEVA